MGFIYAYIKSVTPTGENMLQKNMATYPKGVSHLAGFIVTDVAYRSIVTLVSYIDLRNI